MPLLIKEKHDCNFSCKKRSADEAKAYRPAVFLSKEAISREMMQM